MSTTMRYFRLVVDDNGPTRRFAGTTPKVAASKAFTQILRKRDLVGETDKIKFSLVEKKSRIQYNFIGQRIKLEEPIIHKIGGCEFETKFKNIVIKDKTDNKIKFNSIILMKVYSCLDVKDIVNCSLVNKTLNECVNDNDIIWYKLCQRDFPLDYIRFIRDTCYEMYKFCYMLSKLKSKLSLEGTLYEIYHMESLDLNNYKLTSIPKDVWQLVNLKCLYLQNNKLTEISGKIRQLVNLRTLYVQNNKLRELPREIGKLKNLKYLDISGNKLVGIPKKLRKLTGLCILTWDGNKFDKLPKKIRKLPNLEIK